MTTTGKIAFGSIVVGVVVLGLKYLAYLWTGSIALYSDALESVINVVAAVAAFIAVSLSAKPADRNHPYGHHKVEYFAAVLEGALILIAALSIAREAWGAYVDPKPLNADWRGLAVNVAASAINGLWCWLLIGYGRRNRSPALIADGRHLLTDVVSSVGVLIGVGLAVVTGWQVLDPLLAGLVAINILWSGWSLVTESVGGLMDAAAAPDIQEKIRKAVSTHGEGAIEAHDLRTRHAGRVTFVDFHLVVPGGMTVSDAHDICDRIEDAIEADVPDSIVTIHIEPEEKAKHHGIVVL
ncbi:cation diffusion facilitator family transporter [Prosthecomicrobium hirschii]|uniref:Protein p34 n=1 Tax=Prosthecodimorpha hirschii TaxID=665126 RepID=A0A0P6W8C3_9HYPH|nr:cation diffusion facilitator family transporter [Prosthecomicrobium hirschii]KPL54852.1 cadmium transporter [Prosthecomicrobium hirschii]MCW1840249.1 cation diffusion facilitator family transporter [Prosthecomicrobium hirschii]